jgi:RNA polymerase sigma-70 factor, ECF subfamily
MAASRDMVEGRLPPTARNEHPVEMAAPQRPPIAGAASGVPVLGQRLAHAVERHHALVWRTLRRLGTPAREADDATQHVFITFAERAADVEVEREAAFLIGVAVKVAANVRRKIERRREDAVTEEPELPGSDSPETLLQQKQLRQELDRGLSTLLPEQRAVFVLFEIEDFSLPEIAQMLEIPLGTATSRLRRARDHLETWLTVQAHGEDP